MIARAILAKLISTDAFDVAASTANLTKIEARALLEEATLGNPPGTADWLRASCFQVYSNYALVARHSPYVERDSAQRKSFVTDVVRISHEVMGHLRWNPFLMLPAPNSAGFDEFQTLPAIDSPPVSEQAEQERRASLFSEIDRESLHDILAAAIYQSSSLWMDLEDREPELELGFLLLPVSLRRFLTFHTRLYTELEPLPRIAITDPGRASVSELGWGFSGRAGTSSIDSEELDTAACLVDLLSDQDLLTDTQELFDLASDHEISWDLSEGVRAFLDLSEFLQCHRDNDIEGALGWMENLDARLADVVSERLVSSGLGQIAVVATESLGTALTETIKGLVDSVIRSGQLEQKNYQEFFDHLSRHERWRELEIEYGEQLFLGALACGNRETFLHMFEEPWVRAVTDNPLTDHALTHAPDELGSLLGATCATGKRPDLDSLESLLGTASCLTDNDPSIARDTIKRLVREGFSGVPKGRIPACLPQLFRLWDLIDGMYRDSTSVPELIAYTRKLVSGSELDVRPSRIVSAAQDELRSPAEAVGWGGWVLVSASENATQPHSAAGLVAEVLGEMYSSEFAASITEIADLFPSVLNLPGWSQVRSLVPENDQAQVARLDLLRALTEGGGGDGDLGKVVEACLLASGQGTRFTENDDVLPRILETIRDSLELSNDQDNESARLELLLYSLIMLCADDATIARLQEDFGQIFGKLARFAEVSVVDRARAVLEGVRDSQESRDRVLGTARDPSFQDRSLAESTEQLLGPGLIEQIFNQLFDQSENG